MRLLCVGWIPSGCLERGLSSTDPDLRLVLRLYAAGILMEDDQRGGWAALQTLSLKRGPGLRRATSYEDIQLPREGEREGDTGWEMIASGGGGDGGGRGESLPKAAEKWLEKLTFYYFVLTGRRRWRYDVSKSKQPVWQLVDLFPSLFTSRWNTVLLHFSWLLSTPRMKYLDKNTPPFFIREDYMQRLGDNYEKKILSVLFKDICPVARVTWTTLTWSTERLNIFPTQSDNTASRFRDGFPNYSTSV